jgi:protein phosphatase
MLTVSAAAATDVGLLRKVNEDSMLTLPRLYAVADGMGGHAAGDVASALAVNILGRVANSEPLTPDDLINALAMANDAILSSAAARRSQAGMGTTIAGLGIVSMSGGDHWLVFNIGDSRVYRFAHGQLQQVTVDHSEVEELVAAGSLHREDARTHPRRNIVTRCLGTSPAPEPDVWVFPPEADERFLICSDGLTTEVSDADIVDVLTTEADAGDAAGTLVRRARDAGGRDNITVIIVDHLTSAAPTTADDTTTPRTRVLRSN